MNPLDLKAHFPETDLDAWIRAIVRDLDLDDLSEAAWGPSGGPEALPLYRKVASRPSGATPSWRLAEVIRAGTAGRAADLHAVSDADEVILEVGPHHSPDVAAEKFPGTVWDRGGRPGAGRMADPVSVRLDPALNPASGEPTFHGSPLLVDLTPWDAAGAPLRYRVAAAFAVLSEQLAAKAEATVVRVIVPAGTEFFPVVAMLRAVRVGCERVLEAFSTSARLELMAITAESSLTETDPYGNLLRATSSAVASVVGGADLLGVLPYDYLAGGSDRGYRLARNIGHLLRHEALLSKTSDPAQGAHYVEALTEELGQSAWALFQAWEASGGIVANLPGIREEVNRFAAGERERVESGARVIVGVNRFREEVPQ